MYQHTVVRLKGSLWEVVAQRAGIAHPSPEQWLQEQSEHPPAKPTTGGSEESLILDLAIRHFRDLGLTSAEARELAGAIRATVADGTAHTVGPVGESGRRYRFNRRVAALHIGIGEGRMQLPLAAAARLAEALHGADGYREARLIAA